MSMFFSLEKLILYQEHCQTLFLMNLAEKSEGKETTNLLSKSWTNPFGKSANVSTPKYELICSQEKVFLCQERL